MIPAAASSQPSAMTIRPGWQPPAEDQRAGRPGGGEQRQAPVQQPQSRHGGGRRGIAGGRRASRHALGCSSGGARPGPDAEAVAGAAAAISRAGSPATMASAASALARLEPARNARPRRHLDEGAF